MRKNVSRNSSLTRGNTLVESPNKKRAPYTPPRCPGQDRKVGTVTATSRKLGNVNKITQAATRANLKRPLVRSGRIQVPVHMSSMSWFPHNVTANLVRGLKKNQISNVSEEDNENISPSTSERRTFPFIVVKTADRKDLNTPFGSKPQSGSSNKQTNLEYKMVPHIFVEANTSRQPTKSSQKGSVQDQKQQVVPDEDRDKVQRVSQDQTIQKASSSGVTKESKAEVKSKEPKQKKENKIEIDLQCPIVALVSSQICPSTKLAQCNNDCIHKKNIGEQSRKSKDATKPYYLSFDPLDLSQPSRDSLATTPAYCVSHIIGKSFIEQPSLCTNNEELQSKRESSLCKNNDNLQTPKRQSSICTNNDDLKPKRKCSLCKNKDNLQSKRATCNNSWGNIQMPSCMQQQQLQQQQQQQTPCNSKCQQQQQWQSILEKLQQLMGQQKQETTCQQQQQRRRSQQQQQQDRKQPQQQSPPPGGSQLQQAEHFSKPGLTELLAQQLQQNMQQSKLSTIYNPIDTTIYSEPDEVYSMPEQKCAKPCCVCAATMTDDSLLLDTGNRDLAFQGYQKDASVNQDDNLQCTKKCSVKFHESVNLYPCPATKMAFTCYTKSTPEITDSVESFSPVTPEPSINAFYRITADQPQPQPIQQGQLQQTQLQQTQLQQTQLQQPQLQQSQQFQQQPQQLEQPELQQPNFNIPSQCPAQRLQNFYPPNMHANNYYCHPYYCPRYAQMRFMMPRFWSYQ